MVSARRHQINPEPDYDTLLEVLSQAEVNAIRRDYWANRDRERNERFLLAQDKKAESRATRLKRLAMKFEERSAPRALSPSETARRDKRLESLRAINKLAQDASMRPQNGS